MFCCFVLHVPIQCDRATTQTSALPNQPCKPLDCLIMSSTTMSQISPTELQYSNTFHGSFVWK